MMLNRKLALIAILFSGSALSASEVTVNINGNISSNTCEVDTASSKLTVQMGMIATNTFSQTGAASPSVPFDIKLVDCGADASSVSVTFTGTGDSTNGDLVAVASGGATGLGIALYDYQGKQIAVNKASNAVTLNANADNTLNFSAAYVSTAPNVTAGAADGSATFSLTYE
ncbi:type 1 fimbrial protein [Pantoea sp. B550]|uniref:fimbrial protein n=1 Tax=unclassified Pantoea TaxID=2630326 RepID=UPI00209E0885|nr:MULTISPECIES: fimbrial protein [unclassified Pantoea]MCP1205607.1 type 1 fimbrial protein [Pantoea sp. B550]MCT2420202.1 type 1 fimbrial protein [Pantoea sp. XY16]